MTTEIKLQNGSSITTDEDAHVVAERFDRSRRDGTLLAVKTSTAEMWINPHALAAIGKAASRGGSFA